MKPSFSFAVASALFVSAASTAATEPARDIDTRNAVPASQAGKLPKSEERYRDLQKRIEQAKPAVETARQKTQALTAQAGALRQQLVATASRVQFLEREREQIDSAIAQSIARERAMSTEFARGRLQVSHLLAILERLQSDLPPAIAMEPADALRSTRGAMLLGSALPRVYRAASALSRQLAALKRTRAQLLEQRTASAWNAARLASAQEQLDRLLGEKEREASGAGQEYVALQTKFAAVAEQATDLKTFLDRVAALRLGAPERGMVVVVGGENGGSRHFAPGSLGKPVMGQILPDPPGQRSPGMSFLAPSDAAVVAPADSHVVFAGPYHKTGQILILEADGGYDLVLSGLDRIDVRAGDQLLAGEPVGRMPHARSGATLYFELRQGGRSVNPAPWLGINLRKAKKS